MFESPAPFGLTRIKPPAPGQVFWLVVVVSLTTTSSKNRFPVTLEPVSGAVVGLASPASSSEITFKVPEVAVQVPVENCVPLSLAVAVQVPVEPS